jgi:predicted RNase H-like HicB family nuclease
MEYVYPAIFHMNNDGSFTVTYPDLPGCMSEGKSLGNALHMAQSALNQWIEYLSDKKQEIPEATTDINAIDISVGEFVNLVCTDVKDGRAVKRTVSLPKWLDEKAVESGLSLSRILQDALMAKFPTA